MRGPVRSTWDGCLAIAMFVIGIAMDMSLLGVFRAHLRQAFAPLRYRPNYLRSGRRNRIRY
jgi:hypothetical protein